MLPLLLMLVALLVARLQPTLATAGFIGSLLGYALRSVLSRWRSSASATSWKNWHGVIH